MEYLEGEDASRLTQAIAIQRCSNLEGPNLKSMIGRVEKSLNVTPSMAFTLSTQWLSWNYLLYIRSKTIEDAGRQCHFEISKEAPDV